jgi:hypothetical protein
VERAQRALDVRLGPRADDRHDHAVGRHLRVHAVVLEQDPARLVAADPAAARVDHAPQRVDGHHRR